MLRALIVGADSVSPEIIFGRRDLFPTLKQMMESGASAAYSAYVQKGYVGSYSSEQNWASIATGLAPKEHGINTEMSRGEHRRPEMRDFDGLRPFWEVLNENGLSVGLWAVDSCTSPKAINGYCVSASYRMLATPAENRESIRELQLCEKDQKIRQYLGGDPPPRLYPRTLAQQGYSFEELKQDPALAEEAIRKYCFEDSLPNFEAELRYWFDAMRRTQRECPVDVLYLYTPTTDLIAHCSMCCDNSPVLLAAYQMLDRCLGEFLEEFHPESTVFLSDHGQQNFSALIPTSDPLIQRECFAARNEVLWLKNGYLAFEAHNGALLFTAHALRGTWIAAGKGIRRTVVKEMRTLDIYPTLLEVFGIKIPSERSGYVADVFDRPIVNSDRLLKTETIRHQAIALIQTHAVNVTDIILNELYIANRFSDITLVGEAKYREIFLGNPRVHAFLPFERFDAHDFDEVYCGVYNQDTKYMTHLRICKEV